MSLRFVHMCLLFAALFLLFVYSAYLNRSTEPGGVEPRGSSSNTNETSQTLLVLTQTRLSGPSIIYTMKALLEEERRGIAGAAEQAVQQQQPNETNDPPPAAAAAADTAAAAELPKVNTVPAPPSKSAPVSTAPSTLSLYAPGFSFPNPQLCPEMGLQTRLFIMITSAPAHFSARDAIRLTWGHYRQRADVGIGFIVGHSDNETLVEMLAEERQLYSDLVVANFEDSYDNLTLKTMSTLEWMDTYCNQSDFLLKTDDDMFINVPNLISFIDRIEEDPAKQPMIYGRLAKKWKPVRNKKSKYYISFAQHRNKVYPDFTTGPAYLMPTRLVHSLFEKGLSGTYLKLEDVYTTGIIAQQLRIKRMNVADFANKKVNFHKTGFCALSRLISMHMVAFHEQFELWKRILDGRTKCRIVYKKQAAAAAAAPA